jgi:hypothetical protein
VWVWPVLLFPGRPSRQHCCDPMPSCHPGPLVSRLPPTTSRGPPYSLSHGRHVACHMRVLPSRAATASAAAAAPAGPPPPHAPGGCESRTPLSHAPSSFLSLCAVPRAFGHKSHRRRSSLPFFLPASSPPSQVHRRPPRPPQPPVECSPAPVITGPYRIVPNRHRHQVCSPFRGEI